MEDIEGMLHKGFSAIRHSVSNYLNEHHLNLDPEPADAITQDSIPLTICWKNSQTSIVASMMITAHHRYEWWMERVVFRGQKRPHTDSDFGYASSLSPGPSDTSQTPQPEINEAKVSCANHSVPVDASSPHLGHMAHGQQTENEVTSRTNRMFKRRVLSKQG